MTRLLIGRWDIPNLITCAALLCCVASLYCLHHQMLAAAMLFFLHASICDALDGMVARRMNRDEAARAHGAQLDSLMDACCYGVFPSVIVYLLGAQSPWDFTLFAVLGIAATQRLAWFHQVGTSEKKGTRYFTGMPSTYIALLIPITAGICHFLQCDLLWAIRACLAGAALLFIAPIPFPDLRTIPGGFLSYLIPCGYWVYALI